MRGGRREGPWPCTPYTKSHRTSQPRFCRFPHQPPFCIPPGCQLSAHFGVEIDFSHSTKRSVSSLPLPSPSPNASSDPESRTLCSSHRFWRAWKMTPVPVRCCSSSPSVFSATTTCAWRRLRVPLAPRGRGGGSSESVVRCTTSRTGPNTARRTTPG